MKKAVLLLVFACLCGVASQAQSILDRAKKGVGTQSPLTDIGGTANAILGKLGPALSLTEQQKPGILNAVTAFLKQKANILPLAGSNQKAYTSKLGGLQKGLFGKLKGILTAAQYAKFLGLKPSANDVTNVLSQLFF